MDKNIKTILERNKNLQERIESESWSFSYNRKADFLKIGSSFPKGTFYVSLDDESGIMLRVDSDLKIYGFAIENTKKFIKENPQEGFVLSFVVYPFRSLLKLYFLYLNHKTNKGIKGLKNIISLSNIVAGKATYA